MFNFIYYQLLLLQLEEYDLKRFLKAFFHKPFPPKAYRKKLVFTPKIILLLSLSIFILLFLEFFLLTINNYLLAIALALLFIVYYLLFIVISYYLLLPFDFLAKTIIIFLAKRKISRFTNLKIIGIAGSYGKTSFKEMLYSVLSQKFNVVKTPASFNTPLGISQTILKNVDKNTQIFICEMGEYYKGDIKNICQIARPHIGVITGINEAHLERLGTLENTVNTIFEISENMDKGGLLVLNEKSKLVRENYRFFAKSKEIFLYGEKYQYIADIKFRPDLPGFSFDFCGLSILKILGSYNLENLEAIIKIAKNLGMSNLEIKESFNRIKAVDHRLQPILNRQNNILTIDDSYNGNPDGVEEAINTLAQFENNRKIYVTPGLVEMGEKSQKIHCDIGKKLAGVADIVVLTKKSVTADIEKGLLQNGFKKENLFVFNGGHTTFEELGKIIKSGDVVLIQNDWPDNYK